MKSNLIIHGNCFDVIKTFSNKSVDLIVTSPPYADIKSYGNEISIFHPDNYTDWILPLFDEFERILKDTGSIIFNIGDKIYKKQRHVFIHELIYRIIKKTNLNYYDRYFWHKPGIPNGSEKRLNNFTEYIFHFVKDVNKVKWFMDRIREPYKDISIKRYNISPINQYTTLDSGEKVLKKQVVKKLDIEKGKIPDGLFTFPNNSNMKGNIHPAPFSEDLPLWFIKALTEKNDVVLDPFMGSGTTAVAAVKLDRQFLGIELNENYIKYANERLSKISILKYKKNKFF